MFEVLMVSKPVFPPWNDSTKNMVRDIVMNSTEINFHVMGKRGISPEKRGITVENIYTDPGSFSPGLKQNFRVLKRLLKPDRIPVYHFFFSPNKRTSLIGKYTMGLRNKKVVHTIPSSPITYTNITDLLFADAVVCLSEYNYSRLSRAGVSNVHLIHQGLPVLEQPSETEKRAIRKKYGIPPEGALLIYPGDIDVSNGSEHAFEILKETLKTTDVHLIFACRIRSKLSHEKQAAVMATVSSYGLTERVTFLNEIPDLFPLLAEADMVIFPVDTLYGKMDIPMVLLEAMQLRTPVLISDIEEMQELHNSAGIFSENPARYGIWADQISALACSSSERERLGNAQRRFVMDNFHIEKTCSEYKTLYNSLMKS